MRPAVRPVSSRVGAPTSSRAGLVSGVSPLSKPTPSTKKLETKHPLRQEVKTSIHKTPSSGLLKPKIGTTPNLPIRTNKPGVSNHPNPELKYSKPSQVQVAHKSAVTNKPFSHHIQKTQNQATNNQKQPTSSEGYKKILDLPIERPKVQQAPVKKSGGPPARFQQAVQQDLTPCKQCGRTFNEKALVRHQAICKKVFSQKRKAFNSAKQRVIEKQQINLKKKNQPKPQLARQPEKPTGVPQWKLDSLAFRAAMKQSRGQTLSVHETKQIQSQANSNLLPCKFCGKKFAEEPHARHVTFCERKVKQQAILKKR